MATTTPNLETITMDELRKLADAEAIKQSTKTPEELEAEKKASDEAADAAEEEAARLQAEEDAAAKGPFFAERTVDLGDGAGVQVFKGKGGSREEALEDLSDKLADAQKHATKKIRELSAEKKTTPTPISKEQESLYSAELIATPTIAFKKLFKEVTGVDVEDFKTVTAREKAFQAGQERKSIADQFVINHPEFMDNDRNAQRLKKAVALQGEFSLDNLEKAYQDLTDSGLLEVKDEEASDEQKLAEAEAKRIADAAKVTSSQRTRKASGLSTQRRAAVTTPATPSEDDMYKMPLDELRRRANQQLASK